MSKHRGILRLSNSSFSAFAEAKRAHSAGDFVRARRLYEEILKRNPGELATELMLAELDLRDGRLISAKRRLERLATQHPTSREAHMALANVLEELGDVAATTAFYRAELERDPSAYNSWIALAGALRKAGRIQEATDAFRHILDAWPDSIVGYTQLASIGANLLTSQEVTRLASFTQDDARSVLDRVQSYFALGNVFERQERYDEAFAAFSAGNRHQLEGAEQQGSSPRSTPAFTTVEQAERLQADLVRDTKAVFTADHLRNYAGGHASTAPIFIVGMPRSGSTLLEQILSSHPEVQGLGEINVLSRVFRNAFLDARAGRGSDPASFYNRIGGDYLDALKELGWDGRRRVVDKLLANYIHVGVIHLALPNAVILHSTRDPVDTCLSCFCTHFAHRNEATYDLGAIGRRYVRYREMMAHWEEMLPGRVIDVSYERLVGDPDGGIRRLVADCGLQWHEACLRFNETERMVRTASATQVRQPISSAATQRWRKYRRHLGPLLDALGPYAPHEQS